MKKASLIVLPAIVLAGSFWLYQTAQPTPTAAGAVAVELPHQHYRSPGKPGSAIAQLEKELFQNDQLGPQAVTLQLHSGLSEGELEVQISADSGLTLSDGAANVSLDLSQKPLAPINLTVMAQDYGKYHLNLVINHKVDGVLVQGRALAAEVQFGETLAENLYAKTTAKATAGYQILPVQETIR